MAACWTSDVDTGNFSTEREKELLELFEACAAFLKRIASSSPEPFMPDSKSPAIDTLLATNASYGLP
jgi:hypothetical protein